VLVALADGALEIAYELPQPDQAGMFEHEGQRLVVIPTASHERLDTAAIRCVGEQLYDFIAERLGTAPDSLAWDEPLARAWLPLDAWMREFLAGSDDPRFRASRLDATNWLARHTHLRRLYVLERGDVIAPGQFGRTCPFEVPEGPNIGRIFTIAVGAEIHDGRLVIVDERPEAALGLGASVTPLLEHDDPNRLLMGTNMQRQWLAPPDPEPALVRSGCEPDALDFWCGRNLLTAFIALGAETYEDGIVLSETAARRLSFPYAAEPGDKLSNRHGTKGVVSRIVPDNPMPHLADGTPVELVFHSTGLVSRLNFGQVREALLGRLARAEGRPAVAPPFRAPAAHELRERLRRAGLAEDGMERLTMGRDGPALRQPSTAGWVYWGRLVHTALDKLRVSVSAGAGQRQGPLEYRALREIGAWETIREQFNTRATAHGTSDLPRSAQDALFPDFGASGASDSGALAAGVAAGPVEQAGPPAPAFAELARRLAAAGIGVERDGGGLVYAWREPADARLVLARPVPHPWLPERELAAVGVREDLAEYHQLAEANARLERLLAGGGPEPLVGQAFARLAACARAFCEALVTPVQLAFGSRALFSGRAVLAPSYDLRLDQVGLAEEIAWALFGPLLARELGDEDAPRRRDQPSLAALDALMARSWVIVHRAPSFGPGAFLACHPVRRHDRVIRLHPLVCLMLDCDFDGDQAAVFLPITAAGQREAGELLAVSSHLARDHSLLRALAPSQEACWGLALLSLSEAGRREITQLAGVEVAAPDGFVSKWTLVDALSGLLAREGAAPALAASERLTRRGLEAARASGASFSPFICAGQALPPQPPDESEAAWDDYAARMTELLASSSAFDDPALGPQLLSVKSGARGSLRQLAWMLGPLGLVTDASGRAVAVRHGFCDGLTAEELFAFVADSRRAIAGAGQQWEQTSRELAGAHFTRGFGVLARAMRSARPGIVFAHAAASGERDPLADIDSRLFMGLPPA
jgi:hypothetical protein